MNDYTEEHLKKKAQKRVDFKHHFLIYVLVIAFLWVIWALTGRRHLWPIWPTGGWGIAILFQYIGAFNPFQIYSVEKEIEKLKKNKR
jgi:hypothetical protein